MRKQRTTSTNTLIAACLAVAFQTGAFAAEGTGATDASSGIPARLSGSASVQGGIAPSIFVTPAVPPSTAAERRVQQFAGDEKYKPGQPAPLPPKAPPKPAKPEPPAPAAPAVKPPPARPKPAPPPKPFTLTPHNGLMTWKPGIAPIVHVQLPKPQTPEKQKSTNSVSGALMRKGGAPAPAAIPALRAQPLALQRPATAIADRKETWEDWFERVSHAIYEQWANKEVRPGMAEVFVTIWKSHDVDCQVSNFVPAKDLARDPGGEAAFCQAAIQSIYALRRCEVLGFPYTSQQDKVSFNMTFRREVGGPVGCFISPATDVQALAKTLK